MSASDVRRALQVNGRLCWDPSDLSTGSYPWGGTDLGYLRAHAIRVRQPTHVIRAEELGVAVDAIYAGEEWIFAAVLGEWGRQAITKLSLDAAAGATTGRVVQKFRTTTDGVRQGELVSNQSGILYFSPDADAHPGVIFHKALPMREESSTVEMNLASKFGIPMIFLAAPTVAGLVVTVGLRQDISV